MANYSGIYLNYEGSNVQCSGTQEQRELAFTTDSGYLRYYGLSGLYYFYNKDQIDDLLTSIITSVGPGTSGYFTIFNGLGNNVINSVVYDSGNAMFFDNYSLVFRMTYGSMGIQEIASIESGTFKINNLQLGYVNNINVYGAGNLSITTANESETPIDLEHRNLSSIDYFNHSIKWGVEDNTGYHNPSAKLCVGNETLWYDGNTVNYNSYMDFYTVSGGEYRKGIRINSSGMIQMPNMPFYNPSVSGILYVDSSGFVKYSS